MGEQVNTPVKSPETWCAPQEVAVDDDLLADDSQTDESFAQRGEVTAELLETQVDSRSVEDVIPREVVAELGVGLADDRLLADRIRSRASRLSETNPGMVSS
jgi:hypothetical protein